MLFLQHTLLVLSDGLRHAGCSALGMGVRTVQDLVAFQVAHEFKLAVYQLLDSCPTPMDFKYQSQVREATSSVESNVTEGFRRNVPGEFGQFIRYARGSLAEAELRLRDGIDRHYFSDSDCRPALALAKRCDDLLRRLYASLQPFRTPGRRRP